MPKRSDYISWDEYFYGDRDALCLQEQDPNSQVGACIVKRQKQDNVRRL